MSRQTQHPNPQNNQPEKQKRKTTPRQIAALVCVILLVGMYIGAFVVACLDLGDSGRLFAGCLVATIGMPILLWLMIWSFGLMKKSSQGDDSENAPHSP
ncbi:MAG: PucC family protein [Lachnospiraceae bacterium]|nr:PucC family protein [Lachnospiraceae bacterium]